MDPKPKVSGLSQAVEQEAIQLMMGTSSPWPVSKAPEMQHRLFSPGGGKQNMLPIVKELPKMFPYLFSVVCSHADVLKCSPMRLLASKYNKGGNHV